MYEVHVSKDQDNFYTKVEMFIKATKLYVEGEAPEEKATSQVKTPTS